MTTSIYYNYIFLNPSKPGRFSYENLNVSFLFEPIYVGKGKNNRYRCHGSRFDKEYVILQSTNLTESEAFLNEVYLIERIGRLDLNEGSLLNLTNGGDGISGIKRTTKSKRKISKIKKEFYKTKNGKETAKKNSNWQKEFWASEKGQLILKEKTEKMKKTIKTTEGLKNKLIAKEKLKKFYNSKEGKELTKSNNIKQSATQKKYWASEEGIENIRKANIKRKLNPQPRDPITKQWISRD